MSSMDLTEQLLEEALVAVVPGKAFGANAHIRLSYATSMENITKGMDRIEGYLRGKSISREKLRA
jgi:aspartate aminotransferase